MACSSAQMSAGQTSFGRNSWMKAPKKASVGFELSQYTLASINLSNKMDVLYRFTQYIFV